ncbi:MAG: antibiotic biosynthesis monooxygenase [Alteromonadaceae bacterium]|nr:MAG: antibiotic biosynthesis monooxygenase [Alteromonadaceae bacterium]
MKFGMQAVLTAAPGKGQELSEIMLQAAEIVGKLDGCELYLVQQAIADESKVLITEVWLSQEAHQASLTNEAVRALIGKARPILEGMEHHPARYLGGHGL